MATRRTHPLEFKRSAVEASNQAGASIAGVAMAHGINANQLHKWRRQLRGSESIVGESQILPVTLIHDTEPGSTRQATSEGSIDIQLPKARLLVCGQVDLDVLQTVLAALRSR
jgi:transposase